MKGRLGKALHDPKARIVLAVALAAVLAIWIAGKRSSSTTPTSSMPSSSGSDPLTSAIGDPTGQTNAYPQSATDGMINFTSPPVTQDDLAAIESSLNDQGAQLLDEGSALARIQDAIAKVQKNTTPRPRHQPIRPKPARPRPGRPTATTPAHHKPGQHKSAAAVLARLAGGRRAAESALAPEPARAAAVTRAPVRAPVFVPHRTHGRHRMGR